MERSSETESEILEVLREILKWTRLEGTQRIRAALLEALTRDTEKLIYHFSDGRSSGEVAKVAGVSHQTVINHWKKWAVMGLVEARNVPGGTRYTRLLSLDAVGIDVPAPNNQPVEDRKVAEDQSG